MKKSILIVIAILGFSVSANAGWYAGGNFGIALLSDSDWDPAFGGATLEVESNPGFGLSGFGGYDFGMARVEGEISWQYNELDSVSGPGGSLPLDGDITALSALINGYIDFHNKSSLTPFITAGIGFTRVDAQDFTISGVVVGDEDDTVLSGQVGVGVGIAITPSANIDVKYRYFRTQDLEFDTSDFTYSSHNIYVGFRYNF